ncbi:MAG: hypothetical protein ACP5OJ_05870 [Methanothermobacter sp.]|jgi:hypothetical protein
MGFKDTWRKLASYFDLLYNFDWQDIKRDPEKREKFAIIVFTAEILVTVSLVIGTLIFIYLILFT